MKKPKSLTVLVKTVVLFTISAMLFQTHLGLRLAQTQEQISGATVINVLQPGIDGPVPIEKALLEGADLYKEGKE